MVASSFRSIVYCHDCGFTPTPAPIFPAPCDPLSTNSRRATLKKQTTMATESPSLQHPRNRERRDSHELDHRERWDEDLLQRLGQRPGGNVFSWLAAEFRRLGRPTAFLRTERVSRRCPRP